MSNYFTSATELASARLEFATANARSHATQFTHMHIYMEVELEYRLTIWYHGINQFHFLIYNAHIYRGFSLFIPFLMFTCSYSAFCRSSTIAQQLIWEKKTTLANCDWLDAHLYSAIDSYIYVLRRCVWCCEQWHRNLQWSTSRTSCSCHLTFIVLMKPSSKQCHAN